MDSSLRDLSFTQRKSSSTLTKSRKRTGKGSRTNPLFGANLEFVTSRSEEGAQFVKGFGGIGGLLRYKVDFQNLTSIDEDEDKFFSDDDGGI